MTVTNEQLKAMFLPIQTTELEDQLISFEATIKEMRSCGKSWALDSRQMRVAATNSSFIRAELRRRAGGNTSCKTLQHTV